jgi:ribose transport system permease protein
VVQTLIGALIVIVIGNGMIFAGVDDIAQLAVHGVIITVAVILTLDRSKLPYIK